MNQLWKKQVKVPAELGGGNQQFQKCQWCLEGRGIKTAAESHLSVKDVKRLKKISPKAGRESVSWTAAEWDLSVSLSAVSSTYTLASL